ncbi:glycosyltransferase family 4 protein [Microbacterium album]|uniref:D-inositol 3-phosphate glycosyltransferase n=1 Tax=Microbacterium album TaxID=2053191 RepID=A0A917IED0_9MICO|nr:glycosyltransferase family 4 protein [Microbacterium album]GGH37297.1 glycosyl transferase [Microbacterium album]
MRVAYVCADPGIPVLGDKGASVHVRQIVREFRRRGDEVTVYCTRRGGGSSLDDVRIVEVAVPKGEPAQRERHVARAAAELAARARADGCDLVYERYSLFSDAATRIDAPSIVEVNAPLIDEQRAFRTLVDAAGARATTARLFAHAAVVAAVSPPVAAWAAGLGAARPIVAANGVDTSRFGAARSSGSREPGPLRVCFVGSLKPWHGVETAIDAVAGLADAELVVIGDGPERSRLEERARRVAARVRFHGAVANDRIPALLARMDVGVAPYPASADDYFSPLKVYEYLASGLPVVASRTGQLPAIIEHGATGLLVAPGDAAAIRRALARLRDERGLAERLGAAARRTARDRHDWRTVLEGILAHLPERTAA